MRFTNKHNLPEPLVKALTYNNYTKSGNISVTELISPPRIRQLTHRHKDKITEDASDRVWMLLGNMAHAILERAGVKNAFQEEELVCHRNGWKVSGRADLLDAMGTLSDYKVTSTWSLIL